MRQWVLKQPDIQNHLIMYFCHVKPYQFSQLLKTADQQQLYMLLQHVTTLLCPKRHILIKKISK